MTHPVTTARLDSARCTLVFAGDPNRVPGLIYWGPRLPDGEDLPQFARALGQPVPLANLDLPLLPTLHPEAGRGFLNHPALRAHRPDGSGWITQLRASVSAQNGDTLLVDAEDMIAGIRLRLRLSFDTATDLLSCQSELTNLADTPLHVHWLACPTLPIDRRDTELLAWHGRWCAEFQPQRLAWPRGQYVMENQTGRTSHESFPGLISLTSTTDEHDGRARAFHLAWSGNWRIVAETLATGARQMQAGVLYLPGERTLAAGESLTTPVLYAMASETGLNDLSWSFHRLGRRLLDHPRPDAPRPVHFNSWEAVYFHHDVARLKRLAERAAGLGAERFVLDDGWFKGRDDDQAGLGDWTIDAKKYPDGLTPLIEHVHGLGMTFGLWVEPEMVNPDSDLFRAHPDWALHVPGLAQITGRSQLVLNIARADVAAYLFEALDAILRANAIDYLKWDMNRVLTLPGEAGRPVAAAQVEALYALMARLRCAHPQVEIESCASGGGRMDFAVLHRVQRYWLSDNNDMHDRFAIHHEAGRFFPPETLGAHVGPSPAHTSGRRLSMHLRAYGAAVSGHMGLELDLDELCEDEAEILTRAIAFYKQWRAVLHEGRRYRLVTGHPGQMAHQTIGPDGTRLLIACLQRAALPDPVPPPLRLAGLEPDAHYRLRLLERDTSLREAGRDFPSPLIEAGGYIASGQALMHGGVQPPISWPDQLWLIEGERVA